MLDNATHSVNTTSYIGLPEAFQVIRFPLSPTGYLVSSVYLTVIGIIATIGNGCVISVILRCSKFRSKPHNMLLLNMAIADISISIFGYPFTTASGFAEKWLFGDLGCTICGFTCFTFAQTSMATLTVISVYRYCIVCRPQYHITAKKTYYVILCTWLYSLLWTSPPLVGWSRYTFEPFGTSCSINWDGRDIGDILYSLCLTIFCFLLHVVTMCYCYWHVWKVSRKLDPHRLARAPASLDLVIKAHTVHSESKPTQMSILMIGCFLVCWCPYAVISLWAALVSPLPGWITPLPTFFCKASCALNPIIYAATNSTFRKAMLAQCSKRHKRVGDRNIEINNIQGDKKKIMLTVDRTKEGIFIGQQQLSLELKESVF